jgi:DNA-binding NtrC family response regulator
LFYRLNTFHLKLTGLSERPEDIKPITEYVSQQSERKQKELNPTAHIHTFPLDYIIVPELLPGNVRSIQQIVRRYQVLGNALGK